MLDSSAVFEGRCREMGLLPDEAARLKSRGWNSFALLAFACSYTPGQADDTNLVRLGAIITGTGADDPPEDRMPVVRRLFFEAYTLAAADLRSRVDRREDDAPRKLALPERSQRSTRIRRSACPEFPWRVNAKFHTRWWMLWCSYVRMIKCDTSDGDSAQKGTQN